MSSWIEKAEEKQLMKDKLLHNSTEVSSDIIDKNFVLIKDFISSLINLVNRVGNISPEYRKPSIEIGYTHLNGDTVYEFFGSALINFEKRVLFFHVSNDIQMCWRRIFFKLTDEEDRIKITISEKIHFRQQKEYS
jgi:hypothetical protein